VHSGDSISVYPSLTISARHKDTIIRYTRSTVIELEFNEQNELVEKGGNR